MEDERLIITHPGTAHVDDLLSLCLVLAHDDSVKVIERREATPRDLQSPDCWVLDIGWKHDPSLLNFDHHQFSAEVEECTFSLLTRYFGLQAAMKSEPWFELVVLLDIMGTDRTAEKLGCDAHILEGFINPIEQYLLFALGKEEKIGSQSPLFQLLKSIGKHLVQRIHRLEERIHYLQQSVTVEYLKDIPLLFLLEIKDEPVLGVKSFLDSKGLTGALLISQNNRSAGYSLRKFGAVDKVDFRRIQNAEDVHFVHSSGFMAKVGDVSRARLSELMSMAIADESN